MTTRNLTISRADYFENSSAVGGDGKYEVVGGKTRSKWNNYTLNRWKEVRRKNHLGNFINCTASSPVSLSNIFRPNDVLTCQSRLAEQIKGHSFNMAVSVAEGKKTVNMVVDALASVGGALLDLKRGRFESAARRFGVNQRPSKLDHKDLAGRWLELQYGWLPLLGDVYEASKAYEELTQKPRSQRFRGQLKKTGTVDTSGSPSNWTAVCNYKAMINITAELQEQLSAPRSLGLTDPLTVAWELIPYSFVVDWFIPIGSYLETLNVLHGLQGRFLTSKIVTFAYSGVPKNANYFGCTANGGGVNYERVVSAGLSVGMPGVNSLPDAMSPKRIWNAIALAAQRFK